MHADDLLRFQWVADPQISPDGSQIAFTRVHVDAAADEYRTAIWLIDARPGASPRQLTAGAHDVQPRWSPDGTKLAFVRKPEVKKPGQIHVLHMNGGDAIAITSLKKGASAPAWSPDGRRLTFLSGANSGLDTEENEKKKPKNEPGRVVTKPVFRENAEGFIDYEHLDHVWVIDATGGEPRQLTTGEFKALSPRWSADGTWVLFMSHRNPEPWFGHEKQHIYAVAPDLDAPTSGEALKQVTDIHGSAYTFVEARDGRIATTGGVWPERYRSYDQFDLLLFEGAWPCTKPTILTKDYDFDIGQDVAGDQAPPRGGGQKPLAFAGDGASVYTLGIHHGAAMLARAHIASGKVDELTPPDRDVICGSATPGAERFALTIGDVRTPGDLYLYDTASDALEKLWGPNDGLIGERDLGEIESFWYDSFDGTKIQAWIVKPPDFDAKKTYPLILQIHGGPHVPYGFAFLHEFRVLAAAGYMVLYTNPRGSTSYGQAFGDVIQYAYPGDDYKDLMAGVDKILERGCVDEARMGVTGGSGGGLLTNWIITHTDRFAAAVTQRCVADWAAMYYNCDFALFTPFWFRKPPFENLQEYLDRSPVKYVSRISTPLMVIHSEDDWRTPIGQGEIMFRALKQQRKPTVMVRFPGENHELSRSGTPSRRVQRIEHMRKWFDHWLMHKDAPEYGCPREASREAVGSRA